MTGCFVLAFLISMGASIFIAVYGPKSWVKLSAFSAFLGCLSIIGVMPPETDVGSRLLTALCATPVFVGFVLLSGFMVRYSRDKKFR